MADDHCRIRVGDHEVGLMGLKQAIEEISQSHSDKTDQEIQEILVERLSKKNYIAAGARDSYAEAFLREFNKFLGRPCEEEPAEGLEIKALGPGCAMCDRLQQTAMEAVSEMGLLASVEHIKDVKGIAEYGVMGTPALVVNGKVMSVGSVPSKETIKKWLQDLK